MKECRRLYSGAIVDKSFKCRRIRVRRFDKDEILDQIDRPTMKIQRSNLQFTRLGRLPGNNSHNSELFLRDLTIPSQCRISSSNNT